MEIHSIESFLAYSDTIRERALRVLRAVPPEKLEWKHAPGVFSCGDLARHIAAVERFTFAENALGHPSSYHGCGPDLAEGQEAVIAFMEQMHSEATDMLKNLTPEDLRGKGLSPRPPLDGVTEPELRRASVPMS